MTVSLTVVSRIYQLIFRDRLTDSAWQFLDNLFWSFLGGGVSMLAFLLMNVLAGRLLGPLEYGKFNLVYTLAQLYLIPIYFGLPIAMVRLVAASVNRQARGRIISSGSVLVGLSLTIFSLIYWLFYEKIAAWFQTEQLLLLAALGLTIGLVAKSLFENIARGLRLFKLQFKSRLLEALVIVAGFIAFLRFFKPTGYLGYISVLSIGALVAFLYYLWRLRSYFFDFNWRYGQRLLNEGKFYFITAVFGTLFMSVDKLVIARYLDFRELGVYSAYYTATMMMVAQVNILFNNVFLPTVAQLDYRRLIKRIDALLYRASLPIFLTIAGVASVIIGLFGGEYGFNLWLIIGFSLAAGLQTFLEIYNVYLIIASQQAYKKYVLYGNLAVIIVMLLYGPMIVYNLVSIKYIVGIYILNASVALAIQKLLIKKLLSDVKP